MTDRHASAPSQGEDAAERARREERHAVLVDLLGAYADGELPAETVAQIDAHLVGCARCRGDLATHHAVRRRLGAEPVSAASPALRDRIGAAIDGVEVPRAQGATEGTRTSTVRRPRLLVGIAVTALSLLAAAAWFVARQPLAADATTLAPLAVPAASVPLLRDVLSDYRRVAAGDLPGRARDLDVVRAAVGFPVEPMHARDLRLLAAWTTSLGGEPAAVLAYRWDDRILLHYVVSEERFFRHPAVRAGVGGGRVLAGGESTQGIVAWPSRAAGALLVGDVAPRRLAGLAAEDLLVRRRARDAE